ncbi:MAG TPA: AAA family ATPase [Terriglobales bacterium]|nr:AAA family ATPase [Terriglobales bacterium]
MPEWPFVGRAAELGGVLASFSAGRPAIVVCGAVGVGKTRLARAAMDRLVADGSHAEWVAATQSAASIPLGAVAHLLPAGQPAATGLLALMRSIAATVAGWGGERRPVIAVDDAHLLDPASAATIGHLLARRLAFLVVTVRDGEPLADVVAAMLDDGDAASMDLPALPPEAIDELLDHSLPGGVEGPSRRWLHRTAAGNPLALRELLRGGLADGTMRQRYGVWRWERPHRATGRVSELAASRLRGLDRATSFVLELLACGEPLPVAMLESLAGAAPIADAERSGLVSVEHSGARVQARFAHPIYREIVLSGLALSRARDRWRRLAAAALAGPLRRLDDTLRAAMWQVDGGCVTRAEVVGAGARQAIGRADLALAERLARAAREAAPGDDADRLLAQILMYRGRGDEATAVLPASRPTSAADAVTHAELLYWGQGDVAGAERILDLVSGEPDAELADAERSWLLLFDARCSEALAAARRVLDRPDAGDQAVIWAAAAGSAAAGLLGRASDAAAVHERGMTAARAREADLPWGTIEMGYGGTLAHLGIGDLNVAWALADAGYRAAVGGPAPLMAAGWVGFRGLVEVAQGRCRAASASLREAVAALEDNDTFRFVQWCLGGLAGAAALAGDTAAARSWLEQLAARPGASPPLYEPWLDRWRSWVLAAEGAISEAVETTRRAARLAGDLPAQEALAWYDVARFGGSTDLERLDHLAGALRTPFAAALAGAARGLDTGDADGLAAAAGTFARLGHDLFAAEAHAAAGRTYRRDGRPALAALHAVDADGWRTPLLVDATTGELTRREREVALLAVAHSSREVARRLGLSVRTVDNYLGRAFSKLAVSSRAELRALLGRDS